MKYACEYVKLVEYWNIEEIIVALLSVSVTNNLANPGTPIKFSTMDNYITKVIDQIS